MEKVPALRNCTSKSELYIRKKVLDWFKGRYKIVIDKFFLLSGFRPDIVINLPRHASIIIEVDEEKHRREKKEHELFRIKRISTCDPRHTVFIRYNPDEFQLYGRRYGNEEKPFDLEARLELLETEIKKWLNEPFSEIESIDNRYKEIIIIYLFYDDYVRQEIHLNDWETPWDDKGHPKKLKEICNFIKQNKLRNSTKMLEEIVIDQDAFDSL